MCPLGGAASCREAGVPHRYVRIGQPDLGSVLARLGASGQHAAPLLLHTHLDVVPAEPAGGRCTHVLRVGVRRLHLGAGAVDAEDMVGMALALARQFKRDGTVPPATCFAVPLADEAGGAWGSHWLVENRPDLFDGHRKPWGRSAPDSR